MDFVVIALTLKRHFRTKEKKISQHNWNNCESWNVDILRGGCVNERARWEDNTHLTVQKKKNRRCFKCCSVICVSAGPGAMHIFLKKFQSGWPFSKHWHTVPCEGQDQCLSQPVCSFCTTHRRCNLTEVPLRFIVTCHSAMSKACFTNAEDERAHALQKALK